MAFRFAMRCLALVWVIAMGWACFAETVTRVGSTLPAEFAWAGKFETYAGNPIIRFVVLMVQSF